MKNKQQPSTQSRNPEKTRKKILTVSRKLFAQKGYAGTPLSEITQKSQFNKRMIYHYFGDKEGLYRAVFFELWQEIKLSGDEALQQILAKSSAKGPNTKQLLLTAYEVFFDYLATHPDFVRLLLWESLEGGNISKSLWTDVRGPLFIQAEFLIKQAQKDGLLSKTISPAHLIISILGAVGFYFAYAPTFEGMLAGDPLSKKLLNERKKELRKIIESLFR